MTDHESVRDLVAIGETMVLVAPEDGVGVHGGARYSLQPGGAESNVARHLALLGHDVAWDSALGADPLGRIVLDSLEAAGVRVGSVTSDPDHPTGVYFKHQTASGTEVFYYRSGSAAAAMDADRLARWAATPPRVIHVSGITAALSDSCLALVDAIVHERRVDALVSFDVNHRAALWRRPAGSAPPPPRDAAATLLDLARASDIVFVGRDEAERLWQTRTIDDVRALLPDVPHLVVKDAANEAVEFGTARTSVPARRVPVLDVVGAGDAFAAGWLSGFLRGEPAEVRLALGHAIAARVVQSPTDDAELPAADDLLLEARTAIATTTAAPPPTPTNQSEPNGTTHV